MLEGARTLNATSIKKTGAQKAFTMEQLWRQVVWGCIAAAALLLAILAGFTEAGAQRVVLVLSSLSSAASTSQHTTQAQAPAPSAARSPDSDLLVRQLTQTVRGLTEDRDRIVKRLAAMERNVDDITGSISQQIEAAKASNPPAVEPWVAIANTALLTTPEATLPAGWEATPQPNPPEPPAAQPPPEPVQEAPSAPYAVEIGSASSIKALHARWVAIRSGHLQLFDGLTPVVAVRENPHSHKTELRLVVGPLANAAAAAQLCASLTALRLSCVPTMFDGRNVALE
jgi:hypothetical protein